MRRITEEKRKPYWTFEGVKLHLKNGKVYESETLRSLMLVDGGPLNLPRKNYGSKKIIMEKVHDLLYNTAIGPQISWVELLNVKEYK